MATTQTNPIEAEIATQKPEGQSLRLRPLKAAISIFQLTKNIHNTEHAVQVFDALESRQTERNFQRYIATPEGRDLINRGMDLEVILSDHDYLKSLPEKSLGNEYVSFLSQYGLSTVGLINAQQKADVHSLHLEPQRKLFVANGFQLHDIFHVIMGYDTDPMGEAGVLAFTAGQLGLKSIHKLALALAFKEKFYFPKLPVFKVVQEGLISGQSAKWCNIEDWEQLLPLPLKEVQTRLNIQLPARYLADAPLYQSRNGLYSTT